MAGHGIGDPGLVWDCQGMGVAGHRRDSVLVEDVAGHRGKACR